MRWGKSCFLGVPVATQWGKNLTSIHEDLGSIPDLAQWVKDLVLLWLWCRPASAALIQAQGWEPQGAGVVTMLKKKKKSCFIRVTVSEKMGSAPVPSPTEDVPAALSCSPQERGHRPWKALACV